MKGWGLMKDNIVYVDFSHKNRRKKMSMSFIFSSITRKLNKFFAPITKGSESKVITWNMRNSL